MERRLHAVFGISGFFSYEIEGGFIEPLLLEFTLLAKFC